MYLEIWWLLTIPVFFVLGWFTSRWDRKKSRLNKLAKSKRLEDVIYFLCEDNHECATNALKSSIKNYEKSLVLQRSLGTMFRKQGFFDKAIETHAALLSFRKIGKTTKESILIDLAKDYLGAGIFDRAMDALSLVSGKEFQIEVLFLKLKIEERLKNWEKALERLEDIEQKDLSSYVDIDRVRVHLLCELIEQGNNKYIKKLKSLNSDHPRVMEILSGRNNKVNHGDAASFICNSCASKFDTFFWRCHFCGVWDSCDKLIKIDL